MIVSVRLSNPKNLDHISGEVINGFPTNHSLLMTLLM